MELGDRNGMASRDRRRTPRFHVVFRVSRLLLVPSLRLLLLLFKLPWALSDHHQPLIIPAKMTRAQRVLTISAISATLYFLALFAILPLPFVSEETAEKVLPVVRSPLFKITLTLLLTRLISY